MFQINQQGQQLNNYNQQNYNQNNTNEDDYDTEQILNWVLEKIPSLKYLLRESDYKEDYKQIIYRFLRNPLNKKWIKQLQKNQNNLNNENFEKIEPILQAKQGQIPNIQYQFDPELTDSEGHTICYYLWDSGVQVPERWQDKQYNNPKRNDQGVILSMQQVIYQQKIPDKKYYHNPLIKNGIGMTIAILLSKYGITPPKQWHHDPNIKDMYGKTVQDYLLENKKEVPKEWRIKNNYDNQQQNEDKQIKSTITEEKDRIPYEESDYKYKVKQTIYSEQDTLQQSLLQSILMIDELYTDYIENKNQQQQFIQQQLHELIFQKLNKIFIDPDCNYKIKETILQILNNIISLFKQQQYGYLKDIKNKKYERQFQQFINISDQQQNVTIFNNNNSPAMLQAQQGIIPSKENYHDPEQTNINGDTVAIILIKNNIEVPKEWLYDPQHKINNDKTTAMKLIEYDINIPRYWYHNPTIQDKNGQTIAQLLALKRRRIPRRWQHDTLLKNNEEQTVAIIQSSKGIVPDESWMHDINIKDKHGKSIKSNLIERNYIYQNNQFILNVQTQMKNVICLKCLEKGQQEFIKTKCGHNICLQCFKELCQDKQYKKCPQCEQEYWFLQYNERELNQ